MVKDLLCNERVIIENSFFNTSILFSSTVPDAT